MPDELMTSSKPYLLRALYEWIVDNGCTPHIDVDTTLVGVVVPPRYKRAGAIILNIAPRATNKFRMDNEAIEFEARVDGVVARIFIPVNAIKSIYARENNQGMIFALEHEHEETAAAPKLEAEKSAKEKQKFTVIKGDAAAD